MLGICALAALTPRAFAQSGVPLWTNRYNGPENYQDRARAIAVDSSGSVFVTGSSANSSVFPFLIDYSTIAYSNQGMPLWTNRYHGPGNGNDSASTVAVDTNGNVFVAGYSYGVNGSPDYATVAYSSAGMPLWTNRYNPHSAL